MRHINYGTTLYKPVLSREYEIKQLLKESLHVYNKEDLMYNKAIKDAIYKCIHYLKYNLKIVNLNGVLYIRTLINYNFLNLNKINLYIHFESHPYTDNVCFNLSYLEANKDYNDSPPVYEEHTKIIEVVKNEKIEYKEIRVVDTVSICCQFNINSTIDEFIGMIRHELIHVLHEIKKSVINECAGYAYYYAELLCKHYNCSFPYTHILNKMNYNNITDINLIQIFAACLYYLDTSEYSAWLDSYYTQTKSYLSYKVHIANKFKNSIDNNFKKDTMEFADAYKNILAIKQILTAHNTGIQKLINKTYIKHLLNDYYQDAKIKPIAINVLLKHYKKRAETFLHKCQNIYTDLYSEIGNKNVIQ